MATATVSSAVDQGNDVLVVTGTVSGHPDPVTAHGWVSALKNFYPPASYCPGNGSHVLSVAVGTSAATVCAGLHIIAGSLPRAMSSQEQLAYCQGLLLASVLVAAVAPVSLGISG